MSGHSTWPEWVYVGVVIALLCYVGAEAWNIERIIEHVPEDAETMTSQREMMDQLIHDHGVPA